MRSKSTKALGAFVVVLALSGLTATSALASGAPTVETGKAMSITETTATISGSVNPNGSETTAYLEYGKTLSYGSKTREANAGSGTVSKGESRNLKELAYGTTYHYRMVATNSSGTSYGADEEFSTLGARPELVLAAGEKYTRFELSVHGGIAYLEWSAGKSLTCSESSFFGRFINATELEGHMRLSECSGNDGQALCYNEHISEKGYFQGWIESETLKGTLGYINQAKKEVGIKLSGASSEVWAKNVSCPGGVHPLTGSLGGQLNVPVNTKIPTTKEFSIAYTEKEDKQTTGELGGQLLWEAGYTDFGIGATLNGKANKEFEIRT